MPSPPRFFSLDRPVERPDPTPDWRASHAQPSSTDSMPQRASLTTLIVCLMAAPLVAVGAQSSAAPAPSAPTSTQHGVYTTEQAARGRNVYAGVCSSCHSTSTHSGAPFFNRWGGQPLAELYGLISETMPQMEPASLSKQEYIDVVAYLLQINRMPAGKKELTADPALLKAIRIDTAAGAPPNQER